jgi:hypothetical protein
LRQNCIERGGEVERKIRRLNEDVRVWHLREFILGLGHSTSQLLHPRLGDAQQLVGYVLDALMAWGSSGNTWRPSCIGKPTNQKERLVISTPMWKATPLLHPKFVDAILAHYECLKPAGKYIPYIYCEFRRYSAAGTIRSADKSQHKSCKKLTRVTFLASNKLLMLSLSSLVATGFPTHCWA